MENKKSSSLFGVSYVPDRSVALTDKTEAHRLEVKFSGMQPVLVPAGQGAASADKKEAEALCQRIKDSWKVEEFEFKGKPHWKVISEGW